MTPPGYAGSAGGAGEGQYFPSPPGTVPAFGDELPPVLQSNWNILAISEEVAKDALLQHAKSRFGYSRKPAREMSLQKLQPLNICRYRLETFAESRSTAWKTVPYKGEAVDSSAQGVPPSPLDMDVAPPGLFSDASADVRVPHTSSIQECRKCRGRGKVRCSKCSGRGSETCWSCGGSGSQIHNGERCTSCFGSGTSTCGRCSGRGKEKCKDCRGKGLLLTFLQLRVEWRNHAFEHVEEQRSGFPMELFQKVSGEELLSEEQDLVYPVRAFPDSALQQASQQAIAEHLSQFASASRVLRQRQTVELVSLTKVEYEWHGKGYTYYVYGKEGKVHAKDYPGKCCCVVM